jgi:putative photosynthetic complex assembly protein
VCAIDEKPFPRAPLVGAAALIAVAVGLVGAHQAGVLPALASAERPAAPPEAVRDVRFLDRADGAVVVETVADGRETVVEPGQGGFVRVVLRGFAHDRRSRGLGPEAPFRLTRAADDRLTLTDTATGRTISLDGFGADNRRAFAELLEEGA